jgi:hypothetical protein
MKDANKSKNVIYVWCDEDVTPFLYGSENMWDLSVIYVFCE